MDKCTKGFQDPMDCMSATEPMEDEDGFVWFYKCKACGAIYNSHGYNKLRKDMGIDTMSEADKISFLCVLVVLWLLFVTSFIYQVY